MTMDYKRTIRKLVCCATPGGCNDCPDKMDTTGCGVKLYREAAETLKNAVVEIEALKHAMAKVDIDCAYCAHKDEYARECMAADFECERCTAADCACRKCREAPGRCWEWGGRKG